jgi:ABC-type phosphate/phosphonate transport system substrate-binding protein
VWAVHHDFARHAKIKITNAFLELSHHDPVGHDILTRLSANYYLPARLRTFEPLIRIANDSGMLGP